MRHPATATAAVKVLYLVSCVGQKLAYPAKARELYTSPWFKFASCLAEQRATSWLILSAKYGLIAPSTRIAPYNQTLLTMPKSSRKDWAESVLAQLAPKLSQYSKVVLLAGMRYREFLLPELQRHLSVEVPMKGLKIGEQLSYLKKLTQCPEITHRTKAARGCQHA